MNKVDVSPKTIKTLFYRQIRALTMKSCELARFDTFDLQFSDAWLVQA